MIPLTRFAAAVSCVFTFGCSRISLRSVTATAGENFCLTERQAREGAVGKAAGDLFADCFLHGRSREPRVMSYSLDTVDLGRCTAASATLRYFCKAPKWSRRDPLAPPPPIASDWYIDGFAGNGAECLSADVAIRRATDDILARAQKNFCVGGRQGTPIATGMEEDVQPAIGQPDCMIAVISMWGYCSSARR